MVVHGPGVGQGRSDALISVVDVHRTLVEWVGGNFQAQDSISFVPQLLDPSTPGSRQYLFSEKSNDQAGGATGPGHQRAISDGRWKLISDNFGQQFFDLSVDLVEVNNLLQAPLSAEAQVAYDDLLQALATFP